jgi:predicted lysophospholipase L1 biosynthesis ABC-type transport system permease subunit
MNPLGARVRTVAEPGSPETVYEVIGVVKDTKYADLRDETPPIAYVPITQHPSPRWLAGLVFRTSGPLADVIADVRRAVARVNPNIAMECTVFETQIRERLVRERMMAWLAGFFGVLAAVLATIGLYGVISYIAERRRNEIGIRLALGATHGRIVSLVLRETVLMLVVGLTVGAFIAVGAARSVAALLFGLSPHDAPTFVASTALLAVIGLLASAIPAVRASRIDPMLALRCD